MHFRFFLLFISVSFLFTPNLQAEGVAQPAKQGAASTAMPVSEEEAPTVITADSVEAKDGQALEATGKAELRKNNELIQADHLLFLQESKELFADGDVRVEKQGTSMTGPSLKMDLENNTGEMDQPSFVFTDANVRGDAKKMNILGKKEFSFESASYTSCPVGNDDWLLKMSTLELDRNTQIGTAYNARIEFMGVPFLYTPWMNFPLNDQRRSGLLGPVLGSTNTGGREFTLPIYWNIASNYDATFSPRFIQRRGTLYDNEFRYLGNSYFGKIDYGEITFDRVAELKRTHSSIIHNQNFGHGFSGSLNLNEASDDAYFRDLSSIPSIAIQKNLLREGAVNYMGGWWTASARAQTYQTLQDPNALVVEPYRRLPQINLGAQRVVGGAVTSLSAEYVNFNHPTLVNGSRSVFYPSISYPLINDTAYYLTPKVGIHYSQYALGLNNTSQYNNYERAIPISSVDTGMTLERDLLAFDRSYIQTLEPRIYYVNIPYEKQDMLPNFDSAPAAFSFMQMFTENRFIGSDRIGDAEQVTVAMTSRLLDSDNGSELLRISIGERFSAITPRVILGVPTATTNQSDILFSVGGRLSNSLVLDSLTQYNPNASRTEMFATTVRYRPESGKVFNLGYRYLFSADPTLVPTLKQLDFSTQWPISRQWHMLAQSKYSLQDRQMVEALAGFEYNQDCWALRFVAQEFVTSISERSTTYFIQLELSEMIRVGIDPLATLKQSIPGYNALSDRPNAQSVH